MQLNEKRIIKNFVKVILLLVLNIGIFGFIAPPLISYADTLVVLFGVFLIICTLGIDVIVAVRTYNNLTQETEN